MPDGRRVPFDRNVIHAGFMNLTFYTDRPVSVNDLFNETIYFCANRKSAWRCAKSTFKEMMKKKKANDVCVESILDISDMGVIQEANEDGITGEIKKQTRDLIAAACDSFGDLPTCTFVRGGNDPCPTCPRKITMLYRCGILQDELSQVQPNA